jgi:hypothetical protein
LLACNKQIHGEPSAPSPKLSRFSQFRFVRPIYGDKREASVQILARIQYVNAPYTEESKLLLPVNVCRRLSGNWFRLGSLDNSHSQGI